MRLHLPATCPACGNGTSQSQVTISACVQQCVRISTLTFRDATTQDDATEPHLHVTCRRCNFTWLGPVADIRAFKEVL